MSKEFQSVGQYTEGDINNYDVQINTTAKVEFRALVPAQKKELYDLGLKCNELGADSKDIWRAVFAELGVKQIGEIPLEKFQQARQVLEVRLDQLMDEDDKRRLIGKILRTATEKDAKAELNNFCDVSFGRTHLSNLKRIELQQTLEFIRALRIQTLQAGQAHAESAPTSPVRLPLREFLIVYRANAFWLFMFGIIVDRFWFR